MEISGAKLVELGAQHKRELVLRLKKSLCLYYKHDANGVTLVGVYVGDLLVTGTSEARVDEFFGQMVVLKLKSLDKESGWRLEQRQVILDLLEKFGLSSATPVRVPVGGEQEDEAEGELLPSGGAGSPRQPTVQTFQSLVGSLLWIARCTRPDIAFAVHRATQRSHAPRQSDWQLAKNIARYLMGTLDFDFVMQATRGGVIAGEVVLEAYSDADYAGDRVDRKSVSGGVLLVGGMVVGWLFKKQASISLSTMEAEFVAASQVTAEMLGIAELLKEIGVKAKGVYDLKVDNQAAIKQIKGEDTSGRAKHIDIRYKFVKDLARKEVLDVAYCESKEMRADILTKALPAQRLEELRGLVMLQE
ncbi:hypothetical protein PF005_g12321 [Phytophthora fragariae]|uniref:Reverse transcriptase Ty1/copia-type domain-containing protein n=3 Tax=Phytophthora fragariae TaxID=53985 RepID=A0A6A3Y280_9STRA|nr:hypothetical protein PF011_g11173 [Phytophthora fragariae]KAE9190156.1 hypothetical protein PF004_g21990 [Phytophthora fragariae]KAE9208180.1 hypothetical protein PF005_g12321 [Phytophthora fragariae]KAE9227619.1 hypothetical protein PF002_g13782 [Phytophthora fragariae]